jgi:hypothetical protein
MIVNHGTLQSENSKTLNAEICLPMLPTCPPPQIGVSITYFHIFDNSASLDSSGDRDTGIGRQTVKKLEPFMVVDPCAGGHVLDQ